MSHRPSPSSSSQSHHQQLLDAAYSYLVENRYTSSERAFKIASFSNALDPANLCHLLRDPETKVLDVLLACPDKFRFIDANKTRNAAVYAVHIPPLQSPLVDVLAAATPIERAHEIIDSAWAMEEQGNSAVACERYAMAVELLHCALEDMKDASNRSIVKMLAAECKGRAAAAAIAASRPEMRPKANPPSSANSPVDDAAAMDQSTAILLQSFVGMHTTPAPWLKSGAVGTSPTDASLPKRLQTHSILLRMNHAVEGTAASPHWLVFANAAESISGSLIASCAAGEDYDSEYITVPPPPPLPLPQSSIIGGGGAEMAKLLQTVQTLSHELACATATAQGKLQADRVLQQLRRDVRAAVQALDDQLFLFAERMSSSSAAADAWAGARWNECMAASMMQHSVHSHSVGQRASPVAGGRGDAAVGKKDWGASSASLAFGGVGAGNDSPLQELRREVQQLKAQIAELLPYKAKYEKIQATVQLDRQRQKQQQQQQQQLKAAGGQSGAVP